MLPYIHYTLFILQFHLLLTVGFTIQISENVINIQGQTILQNQVQQQRILQQVATPNTLSLIPLKTTSFSLASLIQNSKIQSNPPPATRTQNPSTILPLIKMQSSPIIQFQNSLQISQNLAPSTSISNSKTSIIPLSQPSTSNSVSLATLIKDFQPQNKSILDQQKAESPIVKIQQSLNGPPNSISPIVGFSVGDIPNNLKTPVSQPQSKPQQIYLLNPNKTEKISGIVLTLHSGVSYDELFTKVQQKSNNGALVLVYSSPANYTKQILEALRGNFTNSTKTIRQLVGFIKQVGDECPNCVLVNWQCSAGYSEQKFPQGKLQDMGMLKYIIDNGYMAMFSDFSLKALIAEWDSLLLGPNPFIKIGDFYGKVDLIFDSNKLINSPSSQLQIVGELSENDRVSLNLLGGTIVYGIKNTSIPNQFYDLEVLSIVNSKSMPKEYQKLNLINQTGCAGHILLTYKSGGHILTSMGHWIELLKLETSSQKLFQIAQNRYGYLFSQQLQDSYKQLNFIQQKVFVQKTAISLVQSQSPGQSFVKNTVATDSVN